jgi:hypothetical protein
MGKGLKLGLVVVLSCSVLAGNIALYAQSPGQKEEKSLSLEEELEQMGYSEEAIRKYTEEEDPPLPATWPFSPSFPTAARKKEVVTGSWMVTAVLGAATAYFAIERYGTSPPPAAISGSAAGISAIIATIYTFKPVRESSAFLDGDGAGMAIETPFSSSPDKEYYLSLLKIEF